MSTNLTPEERARVLIDAQLTQAGWSPLRFTLPGLYLGSKPGQTSAIGKQLVVIGNTDTSVFCATIKSSKTLYPFSLPL